jgi:serine/threonine protein kinase/tetratricopeptide (TPR) repeat protein
MSELPSSNGKSFGHYRIKGQLGEGGMGVVYSAYDSVLERKVAIKVVGDRVLADTNARELLLHEARAASSLNHPNICTIHEVGDSDGEAFIVMEQVEGQPLNALLGAKGLPPNVVIRYGMQIADALAHAHEHGVIHRDLKSSNVMVTPEGRVKVLDFGLAARLGSAEIQEATASNVPLTESRPIVGTLPYLAPELLRGEPADARTDIWSLGILLYEMASGTHPFRGRTTFELSSSILSGVPVPLPESVPVGLRAVVVRCLEKSPGERYQRAGEVHSALEALQGSQPVPRPEIPPKRFSEVRWLLFPAFLLLAGLFYYLRPQHVSPLTEKDTIVLADFTNTTGDAVFDGSLRQGLSVQLEQSPFLSLVSDERIGQTLALMGKPPDTKLTPEIGRELCQRTESAAVLEGSIAMIGTRYNLILKAVNCTNGESLTSAEAQAGDKSHVLDALGKAASEIRNKLGESLSTVQKLNTPLEQATTPSLEALQAYSLGWKTILGGDSGAAVPLFQRAIKLDPNFAAAYALLGISYSHLGESSLAAENMQKAFELREHVSEREKLGLESAYYDVGLGDLEKAQQGFEVWAETYPRDPGPRDRLGAIYNAFGQYDKSLAEYQEALRLSKESGGEYANIVSAYRSLNRFDEARTTAKVAQSKNLDSPGLHNELYWLAFLQNDAAGMEQQISWSAGKPEVEDALLANEADTAAYSGHLGKARAFARQAVVSAVRAEEKETAAGYEADAALREALFGNAAEAKQRATAALGLSQGRDVAYEAALALALAGDSARAQALADQLGKFLPENTIVQANYLPTLHAQLALNRNDPAKAIELLQAAAPYELGNVGEGALNPIYVGGEAYLAARQGREAATEFEKILDHRGVVVNSPIGALAHLGVARAYALQADHAKARNAYEDFFTLWRDADPDVPILKQAKAEYARLN